ncbi:MAG: hypothetical protein WC399_01230 [Bacilli bacterium]|jgi:hypothetical protein
MKRKQKLMVFSALTLVATITALTSFSLAWFENNLPIDNTLTLSSGESVAAVEGYLYQQNPNNQQTQDLLGFYKNQGSYLNVTRTPDATDVGAFDITFSDSIFLDLNLLNTYLNEFALNELAFPTYYIELRIIKENFDAYAKMTMEYVGIPTAGSNELDYSSEYPFTYRSIIASNNAVDLYESPLPSFLDEIAAEEPVPFFANSGDRTNGIPVFTLDDLDGAPVDPETPGLAPQLYVQGFPYTSGTTGELLFTKSIVFEIKLDVLQFLEYLRTQPDAMNKSIRFGISFRIDVIYSNDPVMES